MESLSCRLACLKDRYGDAWREMVRRENARDLAVERRDGVRQALGLLDREAWLRLRDIDGRQDEAKALQSHLDEASQAMDRAEQALKMTFGRSDAYSEVLETVARSVSRIAVLRSDLQRRLRVIEYEGADLQHRQEEVRVQLEWLQAQLLQVESEFQAAETGLSALKERLAELEQEMLELERALGNEDREA